MEWDSRRRRSEDETKGDKREMKKVQRKNKTWTKNRQQRIAKEEINRKEGVDKEKTKQTQKEQGRDEDERGRVNKKRRKRQGRHKGRDIVTEKIRKSQRNKRGESKTAEEENCSKSPHKVGKAFRELFLFRFHGALRFRLSNHQICASPCWKFRKYKYYTVFIVSSSLVSRWTFLFYFCLNFTC